MVVEKFHLVLPLLKLIQEKPQILKEFLTKILKLLFNKVKIFFI